MTLSTILLALFTNGLFGIFAIPFYIRYAQKHQIVDIPNHRSSHTKITPRGGGIFITFGTLLIGCLYLATIGNQPNSWSFLAITFGVALLGLADDLRPLPSALRLCIQLALGGGLFWIAGKNLQLTSPDFFPNSTFLNTSIPWIAFSVFIIWIVGCLNIFNFMDGIDGIATLQGLSSAIAWGVIAYITKNQFVLLFALLLIGGLLAFLKYNWPPARVFMGDCASSFLGFTFAALPLLHSQHTGTDLWLGINLSALMLFPFLFDGTYTIFRRLSKRENILEAHRSHLYQRWTQRGANHRLVSSVYALWALLCGASALLVHFEYLSLLSAYGIILVPAGFIVFRDSKSELSLEGRIASEN